jgi:hypothetical protein
MVLNPDTRVIGPDASEPRESVTIASSRCEIWDLSMWADGQISGVVTTREGKPEKGVTVQAFGFDHRGERESGPLRIATTDVDGRYTIRPLPSGSYIVGINGEKYSDRDPFPPTFYSREDGAQPTRVSLTEGESKGWVDLVLPGARTAATLSVEVRGPDGAARKGARVSLENLTGVQRYYADKDTPDDGVIEVPVYLGEQYIVQGYASEKAFEYWEGRASVQITRDGLHVVIHLAQTQPSKL